MEQRSEKRYDTSTSIICSPFSTKNWCPNQSKTVNNSSGGLYFRSNRALPQGAMIYIRPDNNPTVRESGNCTYPLRTVTLAQVKWCRTEEKDPRFRFGIGVKYL